MTYNDVRQAHQYSRSSPLPGDEDGTHQIKVLFVLEEVDEGDDALVAHAPEDERFHRHQLGPGRLSQARSLAPRTTLDPAMARDLCALDKLDGDAEPVVIPFGADDETEPARAQLFAEGVGRSKERMECMICECASGDGCRCGFWGKDRCRARRGRIQVAEGREERRVIWIRRSEWRSHRHPWRVEE